MAGDRPGVFDDATVDGVAADHGVSAADLDDLLGRLQTLATAHAGVDGLVYEWRGAFREDPLVRRTPDVYYLSVPRRVWDDFADRLSLSEDERAALEAAHSAQFDRDCPVETPSPGVPMVLGRE